MCHVTLSAVCQLILLTGCMAAWEGGEMLPNSRLSFHNLFKTDQFNSNNVLGVDSYLRLVLSHGWGNQRRHFPAVQDCGRGGAYSGNFNKIVGGQEAIFGEFPWMVGTNYTVYRARSSNTPAVEPKWCTLFESIFWNNFATLNMCCAPLNVAHFEGWWV